MSYHRFYFNCQFSALTLLRRLFLLAARHSVQAPSALAPHRRLIFHLNKKTAVPRKAQPTSNQKTIFYKKSIFFIV